MKAIFYTHEKCTLCKDAEALLHLLQSIYPFTIEERDIYTKDEWIEKYSLSVPVIEIADKQFMYPELTFEHLSAHIEKYIHL